MLKKERFKEMKKDERTRKEKKNLLEIELKAK